MKHLTQRLWPALVAATFGAGDAPAQGFGVYRELWTNLPVAASNSLNVLTNATLNPDWPTNPAASFTQVFTNFETGLNTGMTNYGQRLRAFISPASNGLYRFWIASDDTSQLSLSSDEQPSNAARIAWVTSACTNRQFTKQTNQQSALIQLEGRRRYYAEALMQQGNSNDNLCVRGFQPWGVFEEPLGATGTARTLLIPFNGVDLPPAIYHQPSNVTTVAGLGALFSVLPTNRAPVAYQWLQNGSVLTGATKSIHAVNKATPAMSGAAFRCVLSNAAGVVTSAVATLTVQPAPAFGFHRELWQHLTTSQGNSLNALTNPVYNANWPTNPALGYTRYYTNFETEVTTGNSNYGQRVRGYVVPPTTGYFTFWVASDDTSKLFLSADENPSNTTLVAYASGATGSRAWTTQTNQQSAPLLLEKGRRYYLEGQMQQGTGGDHFAARWRLPDGTIEEPLTATGSVGTAIVPYNGIDTPPGIHRQPFSVTQAENTVAGFAVLVTNTAQVFYQWSSNGAPVAGATAASLPIPNVPPSMNGTAFRCVISNALGAVTSATAVLTVLTDTNPPAVIRLFNAGLTNVHVYFSEGIRATDLTNAANYAFTNGGISVGSATANTNDGSVVLSTSPLNPGSQYWIRFNGLRDLAAAPNLIPTNTTEGFFALAYVPADIGAPLTNAAVLDATTNSLTVSAAGGAIHGTSDQFSLLWQQRTGDFDVMVRLASVSLADAWSKAGLMARSDLGATAAFAASFATPSIAGCYFQSRATNGSSAVMSGSAPVNYPNTWLRLQRATNAFLGYASTDGANWFLMGSASITSMPATCYLGLAVSSHQTNAVTTTAKFLELGDATGMPAGSFTAKQEPPGASSRRTGLAFTEIMYHPAERPDGRNLEFVEIFNSQSIAEEMGGYRLDGDVDYTFPAGTVLKAGDFLVVARVPADVAAVHGPANVLGPYTNGLPNGGGSLRLMSELGAVLLEVDYDDARPWPVAADGTGHSLVLAHASYGENDPRAWAASDTFGGTPGALNTVSADPLDGVVVNEFLAHTDLPLVDYVELYNHGNAARNLSGCWLSDRPGTNLFRIPDGTVIGARGFLLFDETSLGFRLDSTGGQILLVNSNNTRVLDAVGFDAQQNSVSSGRVPDGGAEFRQLAARTPAAPNGPRKIQDIVINELMYSPISGRVDDQYVELYNRASSNVDLSAWRFASGIDFTFPTNTVIPPHGFLVVARNLTNLLARYPQLGPTNCLGNFGGQLAGGGERVALGLPDYNLQTDGTVVVSSMIVSEVTYQDGGRWGTWSDGGGSSMELVHPDADTRLADSWADSDEGAKTVPWTTIQYSGPLMETVYSPVNDYLHVYLLGQGECLVDEVELLSNGVSIVVTNADFEAGQGPWTFLGAYDQSTVEPGGYAGAKGLHVRAAARGDPGANRIQSATFPPLPAGFSNVTLRMKARWLRGWPEVMLRMHGGSIEATGPLPVPADPGSPGLPNSRLLANAPPAIFQVGCAPVFPQPGQPAVVTACAEDADGLASLALRYRVDPSPSFTEVAMNDGGTNGDVVAGDGVFSATLPAQATTNLLAYHIRAADTLGATGTYPRVLFPTGTPVRLFPSDSVSDELLVRWGEVQMPAGFATYHLWMTATNRGRWQYRDNLNNAPINGTFVYNNVRAVHGAGMQFAGSPFHRGNMTTGPDGSSRNDYNVNVPDDEPVLGITDLTFVAPGNASGAGVSDNAATAEQLSFALFRKVGVPFLNRRYVHVFFNGSQRSTVSGVTGNFVYEDAQQPNSAYIEQWFPDGGGGYLHKIEDWFEFNTNGTAFSNNDADFTRRVITGTTNLNLAAYRFMFRPRALGPGESANDYSGVFQLVHAISPTTTAGAPINFPVVNDVANLDGWFREMACQRTVGNYDSYGWNRGKNNFFYWVPGGRCELIPWDVDQNLGQSGSQPTNASIYGGSGDPRAILMQSVPPIQRFYHRAFRDILDGPLVRGYLESLFDERAAALVANGCNYSAAALAAQKNWVEGRRGYLAAELARIQTNFALVSPTNNAVVSSNYVTLTGRAPIQVADVTINGAPVSVTWVTSNTWSYSYALNAGTNVLDIAGVDRNGAAVSNAAQTLTLVYAGSSPSPAGAVVFNEIRYAPAAPNGGYVELFNTSSNSAFNLSGWQLNGLGYTFPSGSVIGPGQHLLLADDIYTFAQAHGTSVFPFDEYGGNLDPDGETLSLLMNNAQTTVVSRVRYEAGAPWPFITNSASLQLVDPTNDISRVATWTVGTSNPPVVPQWVRVTATGTFSSPMLYLYLQSAGDVYLDDVSLVAGTNAAAGANVVTNGGFETALSPPWTLSADFAGSQPSTNFAHTGSNSLHLVATAAGGGSGDSVYQTVGAGITSGAPCTLSFWFLQNTNGGPLTARLSLSGTGATTNPAMPAATTNSAFVTPGASNSVGARLPAFPPLWLNEVQASNTTVLADNFGERDPWVELYNAGTATVSLAGMYLSDGYTNLLRWVFPTNSSIPARGFKVVWCDGETNQTTGNASLHAGFRLPPGSGRVALSHLVTGSPQLIDYLSYTNLPVNWSYGDLPDGQPFFRNVMYQATPDATNNGAALPATISINEWMADNTTVPDPADGDFDDWIELFNHGTQAVDLAGFHLTDSLSDPDQWRFPTNTVLAPGGFLLVWADDETNQNAIANGDRHASFKLSKSGEEVGLFSPSGVVVDSLTFGAQDSNLTEGRWPDGAPNVFPLALPTPRAGNIVSTDNAPASFPGPSAWTADEMTPFATTVSAVDTDTPPQTLVYALVGAPAGMTIGSNSGSVAWTPAEGDGPATNIFAVTATDNGWPARTATQLVVLAVHEVNRAPQTGATPVLQTFPGSFSAVLLPATDPDLPANSLSFGLAPGAPAGSTVHPSTGVVMWTPADAEAGNSVTCRVVVTDSGSPALAATGSVVFAVSSLADLFLVGKPSATQVQWNGVSGASYRIEYADQLAAGLWLLLTNQNALTNGNIVVDDPAATNAQRFYRVLRSP